ncbi:conserved domain-containing protein [Quadrisphaera granulorum]|uniref:Uncharacterized protein (TIGR02271 family) n=1 Tax=Quadrisphaera granulorum TaxID=317664 RepID=A0A316A7D0_9ACTN|nr:DUF2382 domain-containing protein [Quadrisphaera granulorum]PWJ53846.1 uncharacterized protein (TIGR02271 family) [Quadrisphaera granulorum]SZE96603.1 conserved domain-containing protein [Quadrisphaera granulorum]
MTAPHDPGDSGDFDDSAEVVLSAEGIHLAVRRVPRERVRVRREVVTEEVLLRVEVRREVLRVEREPVEDSTVGVGGAPPAPSVELVLSEERPVVHLEVVPYERVRVGVRSVPGTATVTTPRRREVVDISTDDAGTDETDADPAGTDPTSEP